MTFFTSRKQKGFRQMKKILLTTLGALFSITLLLAQQGGPVAKFDKDVFDFGKIEEKVGKVTATFNFTNVGNAPFIINRVQTSCGCTAAEYPKKPVLPGEKGVIKVVYNTEGRVYPFNRKITIFSNVADEVYTLTIKGEVVN